MKQRTSSVDYLALHKFKNDYKLYAWVIMPNHMHMLLHPNDSVANVERILRGFETVSSRRVTRKFPGQPTPFWMHGGGYDRAISHPREFKTAIAYIENNPVVRELADLPENYRWSSAGFKILGRDPRE